MVTLELTMNIYKPTPTNIKRAAEYIRQGKLVAFPTETVYGLGADALNKSAVARIFEAKMRPFFDPIIVHVHNLEQANLLARDIDETARKLIDRFWPGPLTLVLEKSDTVPDIVTAGLPTVGVRMPDHPVALALIRETGRPVAAPSANRFGSLSPTRPAHVLEQLGPACSMVLDGGACTVGVESTIVRTGRKKIELLRPGGITVEELTGVVGEITITTEHAIVEAPGQMEWHYAPSKPVLLTDTITVKDMDKSDTGYLFYSEPGFSYHEDRSEILSSRGDLREAAANLFSCLHRLDDMGIRQILAESVPERGLGLAIMNRLRKASKKRNHPEGIHRD